MRVELRHATDADLLAFAPKMRGADALEVWRSCAKSPLDVLRESANASGGARVVLFDGEMAAVYGISVPDVIGNIAVPWLLTSAVVERHKLTFFRIARAIVDRWAEEHPVLLQMVDDEYLGAQLFLKSLGFQLHPPMPHGPFGAPFRPALRMKHV